MRRFTRSRGWAGRDGRSSTPSIGVAVAVVLTLAATGCGGEGPKTGNSLSVRLNESPEPVVVVDEDQPGPVSLGVSRALFAAAPVLVVAGAGDAAGVQEASEQASRLGVPLLLDAAESGQGGPSVGSDATTASVASGETAPNTASPSSPDRSALRAEIERLGAGSVLVVGSSTRASLGDLGSVHIVTDAGELPKVSPAEPIDDLTVLVRGGQDEPGRVAAGASAAAVGARVIGVRTTDLRADPQTVTALAERGKSRVLAVGTGFGPLQRLGERLEVATTGVQLPGGGQAVFPGRRLVALYGHPGTAALGVLGEQGLPESIARAKQIAAQYDSLSSVPVVPAFEIIATVAHDSPGPDGNYSGEIGVEELRPWVEKAGQEGVYVVLDLQPGRDNFLDQAKLYAELLRMPHVGLALDPEWRLTPTQRPLGQIGSVQAHEVNSVIDWLADLTAKEKLPQKLLVLHQFQLSMLADEAQIELGRDEVQVLIHMDGQGRTELKDETWQAVVSAAPAGVPFGWKNFYDEDTPMMSPQQTMAKKPTPLMISYQ